MPEWIASLSVADAGARLVVIPAGYGVGAWLGHAAGYVLGRDHDTRDDWLGVLGGAAGLGLWIGQVAGG